LIRSTSIYDRVLSVHSVAILPSGSKRILHVLILGQDFESFSPVHPLRARAEGAPTLNAITAIPAATIMAIRAPLYDSYILCFKTGIFKESCRFCYLVTNPKNQSDLLKHGFEKSLTLGDRLIDSCQ
jgi:hypothetical protein